MFWGWPKYLLSQMPDIDPLTTSPFEAPHVARAGEDSRAAQRAAFDEHAGGAEVQSMNGNATQEPAGEGLRRLAGPYAVANLWSHLADAGVPPPPLPAHLRPHLAVYGEAQWGTFATDPRDLYALRPFLEWLICDWDRAPGFVFSHYGRNSPTSFLTFFVAQGPLAVLTQHVWGGTNTDVIHASADIAVTYHATRLLLRRVKGSRAPARLLLHHAGSSDVSTMVDLPALDSGDQTRKRAGGAATGPAAPASPRRYDSIAALYEAATVELGQTTTQHG
jgi:hypothetical protein